MNRNQLFCFLSLASACLLFAPKADARSGRVAQLPNGSSFNCSTCHTSPTGGPRNDFGQDVFDVGLTSQDAAGAVVWSALASLDSDDDGRTNGEELGDPDGTWVPNDANPMADVTNPGVADDFGDGDGDGDGDTDGGSGDGDGDGDTDGGTDGDDMGGCSSHSVPDAGAPFAAFGWILAAGLFLHRRRR